MHSRLTLIMALMLLLPACKKEEAKEHPLAQAESVSLCALFPSFADSKNCMDGEQQPNIAGRSGWLNAKGNPVLRMDLISTKNLSVAEPMTSQVWFDKVLPEIKASGRQDWAEPKGPWVKAAITRKENEQELLFEDNGIVVVMQSATLDRASMLKLAEQAAKTLRAGKTSTDPAKQKWTPATTP